MSTDLYQKLEHDSSCLFNVTTTPSEANNDGKKQTQIECFVGL